jgi:Tol biopolymer transport system component/imidazolonepropionase-like amidohydrolase
MKFVYIPLLLLLFASHVNAQKWNVENPPGPSKKVTFTVDEGTWMDLDVSPDGQTIVFDLLGDIYSMPVKGGKATLLAGGKAWEVQPRYSPDGKQISYTSDRDGADNIWVMNSDGSNKHAITNENPGLIDNAAWTPDGQFLIASKQAANAGEIWLYHKTGGDGIRLTAANSKDNKGEPVVSHDGKYIYWSEAPAPGQAFQYNNPDKGIYAIKCLNRETGEIKTILGIGGGACRPQLSPDGKLMAFVKRVRLKSVLCLRNLGTGEEWAVYDDLSHDQQETTSIFGLYPNFSWMPDGKSLIFYAKGKIWNLDIGTLNTTPVPFEVNVQQNITDALHYQQRVFTDDFPVKMIRQLSTSPDGRMIAFSADGYIYTKLLPNGDPVRITNTADFEYSPEFSPDGKTLVYVDWSDELKGSIDRIDVATHIVTKLTTEKGIYFSPKFSNKGDKIIYSKGAGNNVLGFSFGENPGIYIMPSTGGSTKMVVNEGSNPQFSANDLKVYYETGSGDKKAFMLADSTGANRQTLYTSAHPTEFSPSPDGKWMAFTELFNCYITPMINTGSAQDLSVDNTTIPLTKLTRDAGDNLNWSKDSQRVMWTLGSRYYSRNVNNSDTSSININLKLKTDVPTGEIAFKNARIITMKDDEVIDSGTILISQNKIVSIGKTADVQIPADAKVYDMNGKTIMPGIVDVDAHLNPSTNGISPQQDWNYYANLAFGVTTAFDRSNNNDLSFSQSEMLRAGELVGPRVYSTGTLSYGSDGDNLEDARSNLRRLKAIGAFAAKSDKQLTREQRQQVIAAAREQQMEVIPGGNSPLFTSMDMILDGTTGVEHNIPVWPIYNDVKDLWNNSKTAYTPTLIVSAGTQPGENYWYDRLEVWKDDHLLNFVPQYIIDGASRRRITSEYGDYGHIDIAKYVKQIADGGTKVNLGSNGQLQGLGAHWEMWMLAQGGMTPLEVIRCATLNGAYYLGMDKEIGSLEPGKLADLIILNENPLDDIRYSESIKYVMVNGRLFDTDSMNEIGNRDKPRLHFWWQTTRGDMISLPATQDGD